MPITLILLSLVAERRTVLELYLLGATNLRGAVLPVVSLAGLLGRTIAAPSPLSRIVVTGRGATVGLPVDEVSALTKPLNERRLDLSKLLSQDFSARLKEIVTPTTGRGKVTHAPAIPGSYNSAPLRSEPQIKNPGTHRNWDCRSEYPSPR